MAIFQFPGQPKYNANRLSAFWILLELRMMEVVVTAGAVRRAKLHSCSQIVTINQYPTFLQAECPSGRPTNSVKALV